MIRQFRPSKGASGLLPLFRQRPEGKNENVKGGGESMWLCLRRNNNDIIKMIRQTCPLKEASEPLPPSRHRQDGKERYRLPANQSNINVGGD